MAKPKILVTGGLGFIGSHTVVQLVEQGYDPIIIDNLSNSKEWIRAHIEKIVDQPVSFYKADCNDRKSLRHIFEKEENIEGVIHFAAFKAVGESVEKPLMYFDNNLGSTVKLMETMKEYEVKQFIFSSSCSIYGNPEKLPVTEDTPMQRAESPYAYTKQVCERMIEDAHQSRVPFRTVILRYFNPVGAHPSSLIGELPLNKPNNLVPVITGAAIGKYGPMAVHGDDYDTPDGSCIRDYIHVLDLADAHVKAIDFLNKQNNVNQVEIFNVGTGQGNSVLEMLNFFEEESGTKVPYSIGPRRPGDVVQVYADCTKVNTIMGWEAKLTARDALRDAWNWELYLKNNNPE
ncbi:MAG TPA: UDP-glucose 4-epimerase GalE [Cytophagales bacterium]|jgi:UDP-glucose 4-epimerase|nr:UDP-glucose 4-epimerase GalE [Cytophagales bacterium]